MCSWPVILFDCSNNINLHAFKWSLKELTTKSIHSARNLQSFCRHILGSSLHLSHVSVACRASFMLIVHATRFLSAISLTVHTPNRGWRWWDFSLCVATYILPTTWNTCAHLHLTGLFPNAAVTTEILINLWQIESFAEISVYVTVLLAATNSPE